MKRLLILLPLLFLGCVPPPPAENPVTVVVTGPVGFYPSALGADWVYQPPGASPSDPPYRLSILGPATFDNKSATKFRFAGRGQERYYYRQMGADGVKLLGLEEAITRSVTRFNPPMLEYPPESLMNAGYKWGGSTRYETSILLPDNKIELRRDTFQYTYTVIEKAQREVPGGSFQVFRIKLELEDGKGNKEEQEIWFVPNVGEVRTREGLLLVDRNFK